MSQVSYQLIETPLEDLVWIDNACILIVHGPVHREVFQKFVFTKETSFNQAEESRYSDSILCYRIRDLIHGGNEDLKPEGVVEVYDEPAYSLASIKGYHEYGVLESPCVLQRKPQYPIDGNDFVLFLMPRIIADRRLWIELGREGCGSISEIKKLLSVPIEERQLVIAQCCDDPLCLTEGQ